MNGAPVDPTNNRDEQATRHVVIDRRVTLGTCGPSGQRWRERISRTLETCPEQGRSAFMLCKIAVRAKLPAQAAPSLLPTAAMAPDCERLREVIRDTMPPQSNDTCDVDSPPPSSERRVAEDLPLRRRRADYLRKRRREEAAPA
jgi:hypothetical protein